MKEKTRGQIAVEARQAYRIVNGFHKSRCYGWDDLMEDEKRSEEAAANAIWNAAIEEAAKVAEADDSFMMLQDWGLQNAVSQKGQNIAAAIRSLSGEAKDEEGNE